MPFVKSSFDGAQLHYIEYSPSKAIPSLLPTTDPARDFRKTNLTLVFLHGWPMSSQMFEHLMVQFCETYGLRCIATDRRGFGKSEWVGNHSQRWDSNGEEKEITYNTFAEDTLTILEELPYLGNFVFIAASMGCAESLLVWKLLDREMQDKCQGFIWLGPSMPYPIQTTENPQAPSSEVWDNILQGFRQDRIGFVRTSLPGVFGNSLTEVQIPSTVLERFEALVGQADALAFERCVQIIRNRDFMEELKQFPENVKLLLIHGDSDTGMPVSASSGLIAQLVPNAQLKVYKNAAHGMYLSHAQDVVEDVLSFLVSSRLGVKKPF